MGKTFSASHSHMQIGFHRLAAVDYQKAHRWYASQSPMVAERFRQAVVAAIKRIEASPESFAKHDGEYRAALIRRFPYRLWFRERGPEMFMIVAVAHTSRTPASRGTAKFNSHHRIRRTFIHVRAFLLGCDVDARRSRRRR